MRYETRVERIGERMGDIDWSHEVLQPTGDEWKDAKIDKFRTFEAAFKAGRKVRASTGCTMRNVIDVCMYDGWPYWVPFPSVMVQGPLGPEWKSFNLLYQFEIGEA